MNKQQKAIDELVKQAQDLGMDYQGGVDAENMGRIELLKKSIENAPKEPRLLYEAYVKHINNLIKELEEGGGKNE